MMLLGTCTLLPCTTSLRPFPSSPHHARTQVPTLRLTAILETKSYQNENTLYQLLRIHPTASQSQIKAAYRSLAKLYHPDASASSSDHKATNFIQIHHAYAILSDPIARATYDRSTAATSALHHSTNISGFRPTRRWETDQYW